MKTSLPKERYSQAGPIAPTVMVTCVELSGKANIIRFCFYRFRKSLFRYNLYPKDQASRFGF